jgi:hypothetical protein
MRAEKIWRSLALLINDGRMPRTGGCGLGSAIYSAFGLRRHSAATRHAPKYPQLDRQIMHAWTWFRDKMPSI